MTSSRPFRPLILCTLTFAASTLLGCSPTPAPTPSPTPAFASEDEAFAAAEETYRAYNDALNAVDIADPTSFETIYAFSSGSFQRADKENFSRMHAEGQTIAGDAVVLDFTGRRADTQTGTVKALACLDVGDVQVLNVEGASVVNPDRPDVYAIDLEFIDLNGSLLIDASNRAEDEACAGY
ncbi:hypothetical protein [Microbacterium oxydans]|uniref:Nuclear transport factor 2 family protein n=1 Tax=Microbacterium oxydans TaxID=82380 RepID=A0A0F0L365_9MICO|nr:hypothetical protein [Microbacterium oxydans]KJL27592.1 hypothetical protein RS83_02641 [Microbacterium oxydans]